MLDWLYWPADLLLRAGGVVTGWFVSRDAPGFDVMQMMVATLILAAAVAALVYWRPLVDFWRARWKPRG